MAAKSGHVAVAFWDLDNKIPPAGVSVRACVETIRSLLLEDCDAVDVVHLYMNTVTLACAYGAEAPLMEAQNGKAAQAAPMVCPVCGKALKGHPFIRRQKLRNHFEKHAEEHKKRALMRSSLGRNMRRGQKESFALKNVKFLHGREVILELLGTMEGVSLPAKLANTCRQIGDVRGATVRPVPARPQAADQELIFDLNTLITSKHPGTVCLISDDGDFRDSLRRAREHGWRVVVISQREAMFEMADRGVEWYELMVNAASNSASTSTGADVFFSSPYARA